MKKYLLIITLFTFLQSCQTAEQIEAANVQHCANMGAPIGSANYYHCRQTLEANRQKAIDTYLSIQSMPK